MRAGRGAAGVLALLLALGACGTVGAPGTRPAAPAQPSPSAPAPVVPTTGTVPRPPTTTAAPSVVPIVDDLGDWEVVSGPDAAAGAPAVFDGATLVLSRGDEVLFDPPSLAPRLLHGSSEGPPPWLTDDLAVGDGYVVLVEHEDVEGGFRVWRYQIDPLPEAADPGGVIVAEWSGAAVPHVVPQISVDGSQFAWNATRPDGATCIRLLRGTEEQEAVCSRGPDEVLRWPHLSGDVLAYQAVTAGPEPCGEVFVVRRGGGTDRLGVRECRGFQAAASEELAVWMETPPDTPDPLRAAVYGRRPAGEQYDLGRGAAGSLTLCAGRAYWLSETVDHAEIRSWAPGEDVRVVYRSGEGRRPTTAPKCANGWLTIVRAFTGPGEPTQEVLALQAP